MALYHPEETRRYSRCPGCGGEDRSGGRFCTLCGSRLFDIQDVEQEGPQGTETRTTVPDSDGPFGRAPGAAYWNHPGDSDFIASAGRRLRDMFSSLTSGEE